MELGLSAVLFITPRILVSSGCRGSGLWYSAWVANKMQSRLLTFSVWRELCGNHQPKFSEPKAYYWLAMLSIIQYLVRGSKNFFFLKIPKSPCVRL